MGRNMAILYVLLAILASCCLQPAAALVNMCKSGETYKGLSISSYIQTEGNDGTTTYTSFWLEQLYNARRIGPDGGKPTPRFWISVSRSIYYPDQGYRFIDATGFAPIECVKQAGSHFIGNCSVPATIYDTQGYTTGEISIQFDLTGTRVATSSYSSAWRSSDLTTTPPTTSSSAYKYTSDTYTCQAPSACAVKPVLRDLYGVELMSTTFNVAYITTGFKPRDVYNSPYGCY